MTLARDKRMAFGLCVFAALLIGYEVLATSRTPFLSEDWNHLIAMQPVASFWAALDPRVEPLRPFQHAFFWALAHCGLDPAGNTLPLLAHLLAYVLHATACILVFFLARAAGLRGIGPWVAAALYVAFPNVKSVAWSASIGSPGRVCFELIALLALVTHVRTPRPLFGALGLIAFFFALAWHESAMILAGVLALWIVLLHGDSLGGDAPQRDTLRGGIAKFMRALRDPWIATFFGSVAAYAVYLLWRPSRHHQVKDFDALPANVVKAATALLPEDLRTLIIDGLRDSGAAFAIGAVLLSGVAAFAVVLAWKSKSARFVLAVVVVELGLPAIGTGFVQRYACFASVFVALGLGMWISRRRSAARVACILALLVLWTRDSIVDAADFRALAQRVPMWMTELRDLRSAVGTETVVAIVNPPDMYGAEQDIPLFNWGLEFQLQAERIPGPWLLWRTVPFRTSTSVRLVAVAEVEAARLTGVPRLYEFHVPASD